MTADPSLYAKYQRRAAEAFARRDAERDPVAVESLAAINRALNTLHAHNTAAFVQRCASDTVLAIPDAVWREAGR